MEVFQKYLAPGVFVRLSESELLELLTFEARLRPLAIGVVLNSFLLVPSSIAAIVFANKLSLFFALTFLTFAAVTFWIYWVNFGEYRNRIKQLNAKYA